MKKILIVEGNLKEENQQFTNVGIKTHTESLKDSISYFTTDLEIDVANPSSDPNIFENLKNLNEYDGLIWGGSSLNIYNNTIEIRRQIDFMKECQNKIKKMLAICWGMQVAVTAAGGEVKKCEKGTHRGIAHKIKINEKGLNFKIKDCDIWGIQYHPEISYDKMIRLIHFRTDRLIDKKAFKDQNEINNHVQMIEKENKVSNKNLRMMELRNWLNYLNEN